MSDLPDLAAAAQALNDATTIAMACHIGPDGDALGSMLAVALAATERGKTVQPSYGPPFEPVPALRFLPVDLLVAPHDVDPEPDLMVTFDSGNLARLGDLAANAKAAKRVIVVDHHVSGSEDFGDLNLIDPGLSSTAELTFHLLEAAGWTIDERIATCLLTGLVTDTGRFQYSNTKAATLRVAARLVEQGAKPEMIGQHVYEEEAFGFLAAAGVVMQRAVLVPDRNLVWSVLYQADLLANRITLTDTDSLIDLVRLPLEAGAALLLKEHGPGLFKGSMRSRGTIDVGSVAEALGGGGHHNAAGFTYQGTAEMAVAAVVDLLP
ncbi:bifunctional oligoribonuclease/PAP phosphatase NrnA [soil metagenome]